MSVPFWASWYSSGWRFRRLPAGPCRVSLVLTASRWQVSPRQPVSGLYAPSPPSHERVSCSPIVRDVRGDVHRRRLMASRPGQALKTDFRLSIDGLLPKLRKRAVCRDRTHLEKPMISLELRRESSRIVKRELMIARLRLILHERGFGRSQKRTCPARSLRLHYTKTFNGMQDRAEQPDIAAAMDLMDFGFR